MGARGEEAWDGAAATHVHGADGDLDGIEGRVGSRKIASHLGRCPSVVSRELRPNSTKTRGYQAVTADVKAQRQRSRPQVRKVAKDPVLEARVNADLAASWMPNEIAGRLRLEAADPTVERMANSPDAQGREPPPSFGPDVL